MQPTRHAVAVTALALGLGGFSLLLDDSRYLIGTVALVAWALGEQYRLYLVTNDFTARASVEQIPEYTAVMVGDEIRVTLSIELPEGAKLPIMVEHGLPSATRCDHDLFIRCERGTEGNTTAAPVSWPVAGRHTFEPAQCTIQSTLARQPVQFGLEPSVTVAATGPRDIYVGAGGRQLAAGYGEHLAGQIGHGIEPAELRAYVPGDDQRRIDWNATARLADLYVREFEVETDRRTTMIFDTRTRPSALEDLRTVALGLTESVNRINDPLGFTSVHEGGIAHRIPPGTSRATMQAIRESIMRMEHTPSDDARSERTRSLADRQRLARGILGADTSFSRRLQPFFSDSTHLSVPKEPLTRAVRTALQAEGGTNLTVIFTDDTNRAELRDSVQIAGRPGKAVLVVTAPAALYDRTNLEKAYRTYVDFETFRRDLDRLPRVRAIEVGPRDRIDEVLSTARREPA